MRPRRSKYGNVKTEVDGYVFDSQREANRWFELVLLRKANAIYNLRRQVKFSLDVNGVHVCNYLADFTYEQDDRDGVSELIVEDAKGVRTDVYRLKCNLMKAVHGITILEV